tara:strand:- start:298 stop:852 length:555 start_codon:yes stop_codon:yes gene_type:complete
MGKNTGIVKIHGKSYKTVALRVAEFRNKYTVENGWGIITEMMDGQGQDFAVFRAQVTNPDGRVVATGWGRDARTDSPRHKVSWLEIAETSAVGRALSFVSAELMGDELQIASANEVVMAIESQKEPLRENPVEGISMSILIDSAATLNDLDKAAAKIASMDLDDDDKARLRKTYMNKRKELNNG